MDENPVVDSVLVTEVPTVDVPQTVECRSKRKSRTPRRTSDSLRRLQRDQRRLSRAMMTDEQREAARHKAREQQRQKRAALTPEQRESERQIGRERMRRKRAAMTVEQKEDKRQHERERMRMKRASLDPEKKEAIRKKDRERMRSKRVSLDPAEREETRRKDRERMRRVRSSHTKKEDGIDKESEEGHGEISELDAEYARPSLQPTDEGSMDVTAAQLPQSSSGHPAEVKWQWKYLNQDSESAALSQS